MFLVIRILPSVRFSITAASRASIMPACVQVLTS
jgi:hypothetical protein